MHAKNSVKEKWFLKALEGMTPHLWPANKRSFANWNFNENNNNNIHNLLQQ